MNGKKRGAISLGGAASSEYDKRNNKRSLAGRPIPHATNAIATRNVIHDYEGPAVEFTSCANCKFINNTIYNTGGGFKISIGQDVYTENVTIRNNKLHNITSGIIFMIEYGAERGLNSEGNVYYIDKAPIFIYKNNRLTHEDFQGLLRTDLSSNIQPSNAFRRE
jgi:hypothetical protein